MAESVEKTVGTALYFTSVVAMRKDYAIFGGHLISQAGNPRFTRCMFFYNGVWRHLVDLDEVAYGASRKPPTGTSTGVYCILGREGSCYEAPSGGAKPVNTIADLGSDGFLVSLKWIGNHLYACGMQNQVFRQEGETWKRIDQGIFVPRSDGASLKSVLKAIDGFSDADIYAVGNGGRIWHWDGSGWAELESPTNYNLHSVLCASNGDVYVGGGKGILFAGSASKGWRELTDQGVTSQRLEDMTEFQGKVYIAAEGRLLSITADKLQSEEVPGEGIKIFYRLDSNSEEMWSVGDDCILQFDGSKWTRHVCPENE